MLSSLVMLLKPSREQAMACRHSSHTHTSVEDQLSIPCICPSIRACRALPVYHLRMG